MIMLGAHKLIIWQLLEWTSQAIQAWRHITWYFIFPNGDMNIPHSPYYCYYGLLWTNYNSGI